MDMHESHMGFMGVRAPWSEPLSSLMRGWFFCAVEA